MYLRSLSLINFRNIASADLEFSPQVNCFTGNNGAGKTGLLDAVHYLALCKSYFNPVDSQNIRHNEAFFVVEGRFTIGNEEENIYCGQKRNTKKQFKRNKKEYSRLAEHIGLIPLVMVSPADTELVTGGSEARRKFTDSVISQYNRDYLYNLINYNNALSQRNALLKSLVPNSASDYEQFELWDNQLVAYGQNIFHQRKEFIEQTLPAFTEYYRHISGGTEEVGLVYESQLERGDFATQLKNAFQRDRILQYTTVGIHKDDLALNINGYAVKRYGSQGQQKSFLVALKLAEYDFMKKVKGYPPLLLLDDIFDKLDESRITRLIEKVSSENFGQVFITDTHENRLKNIFGESDKSVNFFTVENGEITVSKEFAESIKP